MNFKNFRQTLSCYPEERLVFVGLGNPIRKDDFAGLFFLERLRESGEFRAAGFIAAGTNPENYLKKILDFQPRAVIFIDAARFHAEAGTIQFLSRDRLDEIRISTHAFSMTLVEDFLRSELELDFYYLGIEPEETGIGEGLSPIVSDRIRHFFDGR